MSDPLVQQPANAVLRPARTNDVPEIHKLLQEYADRGNLLPRSEDELFHALNDFSVIIQDGQLLACGALEIFTEDLGEVRSLVVADQASGRGLGRRMVDHLSAIAVSRGLRRLMALTYVPEFFHKLGFHTVAKDSLPEKVWGICVKCYKYHHCDEVAVLKRL